MPICKKKMNNRRSRKSSGVACCRFNTTSDKMEVLLVKKRYTYSFVSFVFGQYSIRNEKELKSLFNGMTMQEKIDIMSLKFDLMWYKIFLEFPERVLREKWKASPPDDTVFGVWKIMYKQRASSVYDSHDFNGNGRLSFYMKKKNKFESAFLGDKGKYLKTVMMGTTHTDLAWEIPKGRKTKKETVLDCAIREFKEETGVGIDDYKIMFDINPVIDSYTSMNVTYTHSYYIAFTSKIFSPTVNIDSVAQVAEIDSIKWVDIGEIKYVDNNGRLCDLIERVSRIFKSRYMHVPI